MIFIMRSATKYSRTQQHTNKHYVTLYRLGEITKKIIRLSLCYCQNIVMSLTKECLMTYNDWLFYMPRYLCVISQVQSPSTTLRL